LFGKGAAVEGRRGRPSDDTGMHRNSVIISYLLVIIMMPH